MSAASRTVGFLVALVLVMLAAANCGGSSGPTVAELEEQRDIAGLLEVVGEGGSIGAREDAIEALQCLDDPTTYTLLEEMLRTEKYPGGEYAGDWKVLDILGAVGGTPAAPIIIDWARANYEPAMPRWPDSNIVHALTAMGSDADETLAAVIEAPVLSVTADGREAKTVDDYLRGVAFKALGGAGAPEGQRPVSTGPLGSDRAEQALLTALRAEPFCELGDCSSWGEAAGVAIVHRRQADPTPVFALLEDPASVRVYSGLVQLGLPGSEPQLIAALERNAASTRLAKSMSETYVNSGNDLLDSAGRSWFHSNGYLVIPGICTTGNCEELELWGTLNDPD
ncbi:MAG: hypothetical protein IH609_01165 [Dehalococcoidia bacterium]|nr:hypothetical protein [Dehalococcoidia bacterium]